MATDELPEMRPALVKYMHTTWTEPMLQIETPPIPFDFQYPIDDVHNLLDPADETSKKIVADFMDHCKKTKANGDHIVLVAFWYANNRAPIIKERIVRGDNIWILSHDTELLYILGDKLDPSGRNKVEHYRYYGRKCEWVNRGVHDGLDGTCILLRNERVKRMPGFANMSRAFKKGLPTR